MGISTFKGGVHPYDGKDLAKDQPIRRIKPKEILVYPSKRIRKRRKKDCRSRRICVCTGFRIRIRYGKGNRAKTCSDR